MHASQFFFSSVTTVHPNVHTQTRALAKLRIFCVYFTNLTNQSSHTHYFLILHQLKSKFFKNPKKVSEGFMPDFGHIH